jgi:hypothetical protein
LRARSERCCRICVQARFARSPKPSLVLPFEQAAEGIAMLDGRHSIGKIAISLDGA